MNNIGEIKSLVNQDWEIKELGDMFGGREFLNGWLEKQEYNKDLHYIEITIKVVPK